MLDGVSATLVALSSFMTVFAAFMATLSATLGTITAAVVAIWFTWSGFCGHLVALIPHPSEEGFYHNFHHFLNLCAMNVGNAKNAVTGIVPKGEENAN